MTACEPRVVDDDRWAHNHERETRQREPQQPFRLGLAFGIIVEVIYA